MDAVVPNDPLTVFDRAIYEVDGMITNGCWDMHRIRRMLQDGKKLLENNGDDRFRLDH